MPLTQDPGPYAEMLRFRQRNIHENDGLGSALVSHLKFTFTPLRKNIVFDPWTATLSTKSWISLGSTGEKEEKYNQLFKQSTAAFRKTVVVGTATYLHCNTVKHWNPVNPTTFKDLICVMNGMVVLKKKGS